MGESCKTARLALLCTTPHALRSNVFNATRWSPRGVVIPMTRIILVRHGRTEWNKGEIFRGTVDIPLDEQGRKEAACAGDWLKAETFHVAYSSPLSRAVETAEIILEPHGLAVHKHEGLIDLNYGAWQGKPNEEVKRVYPELYQQWRTAPQYGCFPGRRRARCGPRQIPVRGRGGGGQAPGRDGTPGGTQGGQQGSDRRTSGTR